MPEQNFICHRYYTSIRFSIRSWFAHMLPSLFGHPNGFIWSVTFHICCSAILTVVNANILTCWWHFRKRWTIANTPNTFRFGRKSHWCERGHHTLQLVTNRVCTTHTLRSTESHSTFGCRYLGCWELRRLFMCWMYELWRIHAKKAKKNHSMNFNLCNWLTDQSEFVLSI